MRRLLKDGQETLAEKKEVREKQMALAKKVLENVIFFFKKKQNTKVQFWFLFFFVFLL